METETIQLQEKKYYLLDWKPRKRTPLERKKFLYQGTDMGGNHFFVSETGCTRVGQSVLHTLHPELCNE